MFEMGGTAVLLWGMLFGSIGFGFFLYGKKQKAVVPLITGIALCVVPYFIANVYALVIIGVILTRIIHEGFYCNRRYAAATSLTAGGLAARSVNILFQVCLPSSRLHAPVSRGVSAVSSRTPVNNAG
jgi:hypothetical protein